MDWVKAANYLETKVDGKIVEKRHSNPSLKWARTLKKITQDIDDLILLASILPEDKQEEAFPATKVIDLLNALLGTNRSRLLEERGRLQSKMIADLEKKKELRKAKQSVSEKIKALLQGVESSGAQVSDQYKDEIKSQVERAFLNDSERELLRQIEVEKKRQKQLEQEFTEYVQKLNPRLTKIAADTSINGINYCIRQFNNLDNTFSKEVTAPLAEAQGLLNRISERIMAVQQSEDKN